MHMKTIQISETCASIGIAIGTATTMRNMGFTAAVVALNPRSFKVFYWK